MTQRNSYKLFTLAALLSASQASYAGPYTDDLSKCMVAATTDQDRGNLVEWIFFSLSLNPRISPYAQVTAAQRETADRNLAALFEKLVVDSCSPQTKQAIKYEGTGALEESFTLLSQVAAQEIFKDPAVTAGTSKFTEYLDEEKLSEAMGLPAGTE